MAVSGSFDAEFDFLEYLEEAYENCGQTMRTANDIKTGLRSMNLLLADWANQGLNQWTIDQVTLPLVAGTASYALGADTIDILNCTLRRGGVDYVLERVSRPTFLSIPNKSTQGRPNQYFVDRQINPTLELWLTPENSTDVIVYNRLHRIDDVDAPANTLGIPFRFYPALAAGLAYFMAPKLAPDRMQMLKLVYDERLNAAKLEDRDRSSFIVTPYMGR